MPYPFKSETREEKLEKALMQVWILMSKTVSDSASAHLESVLTELNIEHEVELFNGTAQD